AHVEQLLAAVTAHPAADGVAFTDTDGRRQPLAAVYRSTPLRVAARELGEVEGASMRSLTNPLTVVEVEADSETTLDCDTWDDVARARKILEER
ncbi:MAG: molybdenum cofactor guanylyltransferase, partial [Propionibacteriales bacterium]|nr:molybdenum cofactor guanylyltransferase [Propionibacteriales bacterium]